MGSIKVQINKGLKRKPVYATVTKFVYKMSTLYTKESIEQIGRQLKIKNIDLLEITQLGDRIEVGETKVIGN